MTLKVVAVVARRATVKATVTDRVCRACSPREAAVSWSARARPTARTWPRVTLMLKWVSEQVWLEEVRAPVESCVAEKSLFESAD